MGGCSGWHRDPVVWVQVNADEGWVRKQLGGKAGVGRHIFCLMRKFLRIKCINHIQFPKRGKTEEKHDDENNAVYIRRLLTFPRDWSMCPVC